MVLTGNTVDISVFCFKFWQAIMYLDPKIKFPDIKWKKERFIGIAWDHGDPFTHLIWTEPDEGAWQKGRELVQNVVRPREEKVVDNTLDLSSYDVFSLVKNMNFLPKAETAKLLKKRQRDGADSLNPTTPPSKCGCNASASDLDAVEQGTNSEQDNQPITDSDNSSHQTLLDVNKEGEITVT
eukprot:6161560-Ditylum_brightwellii.AAC.1